MPGARSGWPTAAARGRAAGLQMGRRRCWGASQRGLMGEPPTNLGQRAGAGAILLLLAR